MPTHSRWLTALALCASASAQDAVSFSRDIAPILQRRCVNCHGEDNAKGGYRLDTFTHLAKPGDSGEAPLTGELIRLITTTDDDARMPQKAPPLPAEETTLIRHWLENGAPYDAATPEQPIAQLVRSRFLRPAPTTYPRPLPITALAFDSTGQHLAVSGWNEILLFRTSEGTIAHRIGGLPERITSLAWHPRENTLAIAGGTPGQWGTIALVENGGKGTTRILCDLTDQTLSVAFSPDGKLLAAASSDRTVRIFDTTTGKQTRILRPHADWVQSVAFNPAGTHIVTASRDRTARVLDATTGEAETTFRLHDTPLFAAIFAENGRRVYSSARGGTGHIWSPQTAGTAGKFGERGTDFEKLAISGDSIVLGGSDGTVRLQQTGAREPWLTFHGTPAPVQSLAASRDGTLIASGSADGTIFIWSPACGTWTTRFEARP